MTDDRNGRPIYAVEFSKEEMDNEERRPKRKVAVMIGYSGSGYKGMQLLVCELKLTSSTLIV